MVLTEKEYGELVKDFDSVIQKVDEQSREEVVKQIKKLELKYWGCVKEATFFRYLIRFGELNKVLWLLDVLVGSKKELKRIQSADSFYANLQQDIKDWQRELFNYWQNYDPNPNHCEFIREMRKLKWGILRIGMNLYSGFLDKIFALF